MMFWEEINQRKFPRAQYQCKIKVIGSKPDLVIDTFTENIGVGGICIILEKSFELFKDVCLEIFLNEENDPVICTGTIVWVVKKHPKKKGQKVSFDMGIEFLNISQEDKKKIARLVDKLLSGQA